MPLSPAVAATALSAMLVTTGRCSRRGLLVCAGVLLALQIAFASVLLAFAIPHEGVLIYLIDAGFLWLASAAAGKRLHDLGLSARLLWWAALATLAWAVVLCGVLMLTLPAEAFEIGGYGYVLGAVGTSLPVLALTLWLHLTPGMQGPNRYGVAPGPSGFCGGLPLSGEVVRLDERAEAEDHPAPRSVARPACGDAH